MGGVPMQGVAFSSQPGMAKRRGRDKSGEIRSPGQKSGRRQRASSVRVRNRSWLMTRAQKVTVEGVRGWGAQCSVLCRRLMELQWASPT